ncbi:MAG: signal peptide peptidase SppA [Planctomycetes bacterium]|nr:signal peptide peptidase SppA [Planctomycetota bacterium]MBU1518610.1 signal peptide peptidase SppA [Planctomycetota bacterium]
MGSSENPYQLNSPPPAPKRVGWKIFFGIILGLSIIANFVLFFALIAVGVQMLAGTGAGKSIVEKEIEAGPGSSKIAVIKIEGVINSKLAEDVSSQIKAAKKDKNVKAVIFKTTSPGGGIGASDRIHDQISRLKAETGKPTIAFMETIATSGGYYTSAACDKIVAEPTAITGSIGVIMGHFVLQDLLEEKLGIKPVIIKSGPKKDWPTSFEPVTEEQVAYLDKTLITPAYERFVDIVAKGRGELTREQILALADGSVYNALQAFDNKLIDEIGYMDEAIAAAKSLANITDAKVVEYKKPFSFEEFLGTKSFLHLDRNTLYEFTTPQLMYLWDAGLNF